MKEKVKEFSKKYLLGFILGMLSAGVVAVYAATYFPSNQTAYDNSESGMTSTNVQDAIDELYGVCGPSAGEKIIENGNLEKDEYECRYFFTGANPNNYITFNDEEAGWRIISIGCDDTIKIMRNDSIGSQSWDTSGSNNWARPASLNTYLNGTYYNSLTSESQNQIVISNFSIGNIQYGNNDLATQVNDENSEKWNGKISLLTSSEYIRTNSNKNKCGSFADNTNDYSCNRTTWAGYSSLWWLLTPSSSSSFTYTIASTGGAETGHVGSNIAVRPVVTLSSEVQITGGDGSQSNPYILK